VEHDGRAFAADEINGHHHGNAGGVSVHVRAVVTWAAIFPMAALGMKVIADVAPGWDPVLRALVLTAVVVPTAVYLAVPRLLFLYARVTGKKGGRARRRG
jgi:antibiotic biosynthesis monooxygenase (ABM) superfamily enzyme